MLGFDNGSMSEPQLRIVTVADSSFAQTLLNLFVEAHSNMILVGEAHDGTEAIQMIAWSQPDLLVMDFNLLMLDGIAAIRQIKLDTPQFALSF